MLPKWDYHWILGFPLYSVNLTALLPQGMGVVFSNPECAVGHEGKRAVFSPRRASLPNVTPYLVRLPARLPEDDRQARGI